MAGCAVLAGAAIGLDIEPRSRNLQWQKIVERWFTAHERDWLSHINDSETFLKTWTLKEAWLKATGRGIAGNLHTLEISSGFVLRGDRPEQAWKATLGHSGNYLIALVSQGTALPAGFMIPGLIDIDNPEAGAGSALAIDWILQREIY